MKVWKSVTVITPNDGFARWELVEQSDGTTHLMLQLRRGGVEFSQEDLRAMKQALKMFEAGD
jgi:hypothetical protein